MKMGSRLREIAERATAIETAIDDVIMCHDWHASDTPLRTPKELREQLAEAIERLKLARA